MRNRSATTEVVLVRHAQSIYDRDNRFSGWADPALTEAGIAEARAAGRQLRDAGYRFDHSYSSVLQSSVQTLSLIHDELGQSGLGSQHDWRLNERHYGALQGQDKGEVGRINGRDQLQRWRRGYLDLPPPMPPTDAAHPFNNAAYAGVAQELLPSRESLDMARRRVVGFWQEQVAPRIHSGERLLLSSHGNALRALMMELDGMSVREVERLEIPAATPIVVRIDRDGRAADWHYLAAAPCLGCAA